MTPQKVLSDRVREWAASQGICTAAVARILGISEMTLWRRLHGHCQWHADELLKLRGQGIQISDELFHALVGKEEVLRMSKPKPREEWIEDALCRRLGLQTEIFFPERARSSLPAKQVCRECPVRQECLADQLEYEARGTGQITGIFGGLTPSQRAPLVRKIREARKETRKEKRS